MPFRATSIIWPDKRAPVKIPMEANMRMVLTLVTLLPIAEFRKLTASLLTPTIKSIMANKNNKATKTIKSEGFMLAFKSKIYGTDKKEAFMSIMQNVDYQQKVLFKNYNFFTKT